MINTHALTNPSPADSNIRTGMDRLGMLREGSNTSYFHGKFNSRQFSVPENRLSNGGIISFPIPQTVTANHPVPFTNALTDKPLPMYDLYHSPLAPQFNPLAVTLDMDFVKKYNTVKQN